MALSSTEVGSSILSGRRYDNGAKTDVAGSLQKKTTRLLRERSIETSSSPGSLCRLI
jgi:hypothetical protein